MRRPPGISIPRNIDTYLTRKQAAFPETPPASLIKVPAPLNIVPAPFNIVPASLVILPAPFNIVRASLVILPAPFNIVPAPFNISPAPPVIPLRGLRSQLADDARSVRYQI